VAAYRSRVYCDPRPHRRNLRTLRVIKGGHGRNHGAAALAAAGPVSLHAATVTRTSPIDLVGPAPALNEAAFATPVGSVSELVEIPAGYALVRPEERLPVDFSGLAEAKGALREAVVKERQAARVNEWMAEVRARARLRNLVDS